MEKYNEIINMLASRDYHNVSNILDNIDDKDNLIEKIIYIDNPHIYDRFSKMLEYKYDTLKLNEIRNKYIKRIVLNQNSDRKLSYFNNIDTSNYNNYLFTSDELYLIKNSNDFDSTINKISNRWLSEYIINYFYNDNYYNYMINLYQMVSFIGSTKLSLLNRNHIDIYNEFRGLNNISFKDKIALFKKYDGMDLSSMFYDDMSRTRDESHRMLVDSSLKLNHESCIYYKEISRNYGIDIYYLNGEKFYGFVRCLTIPKSPLFKYYDYVNSEGRRLGYSFSYIGDKNIGTTDYDQNGVTLFYDKINYEDIMYVHHADLHSKRMNKQDDYLTHKINEITTPSSLIANTRNYNEIFIKNNTKRIVPTALICYDEINNNDIAFAKKYNLSILLINRSKYNRYELYDENFINDTYVI